MLLITAAIAEELKTAMELSSDRERIHCPGVRLYRAVLKEKPICFLKTGVGPEKAAASLEKALDRVTPERILVIGYGGALDPDLRLGHVVAINRALAFRFDDDHPDWEHIRVEGSFHLSEAEALSRSAAAAGLTAFTGDALTSSYVLGDPAHKDILCRKFNASVVDMETAALARVAQYRSIPISCIRVISDEAEDNFLLPFSNVPLTSITTRAKELFKTGMPQLYQEWKDRTLIANECLRRFVAAYL
jgi:adenosylhomocysteine nucleosidase